MQFAPSHLSNKEIRLIKYPKAPATKAAALAALMLALSTQSGIASAAPPSGEVQFARNIVEPAYDSDGSITYLMTPENARLNLNPNAFAPLYVVLYPASVANGIGTVICQHQPMDNCPDHGPALAGLAQAVAPSVYGSGVWGHDHLLSAPPAPPSEGADFNVAWMPVAVVFNTVGAATRHITTAAQLDVARALGEVTEIPLPPATFHGSPVSASVYQRGIPVLPAPPLP